MNANNDEVKQHWISVDDQMPEYCTPVLVFCANSNFKHDGLKTVVAAYQHAKELFETSEIFDSEDEATDSWVAETSLFDSEYGGRFLDEEVTHWMPLPAPPAQKETICCECNDPFIFKRGSTTEDTCERCVLEYVTSHCDY